MKKTLFYSLFIFLLALSVSGQSNTNNCLRIEVLGPPALVPVGQTASFYVNTDFENPANLTFKWSVDKGAILSGQGTPVIKVVATDNLAGQIIRSTVEIGGLPKGCDNVFSDTAEIFSGGSPIILDQIPKVSTKDFVSRIDRALVRLKKEFEGNVNIAFVTFGLESEANRRKRVIQQRVNAASLDPDKVAIMHVGARKLETRILILPSNQQNRFSSKDDVDCICFDRVGVESDDKLTSRIDGLLYELANSPGKTGFIYTYGTARDTARRHRVINRYLAVIDFSRFEGVRRVSKENVVMVEAGAHDSLFSNFVIAENAFDYPKCRCDGERIEMSNCPKLEVIGPAAVTQIGETMTFRVEGGGKDLRYEWTVDKGRIIGESNEALIVVGGTDVLAGAVLTGSVTVKGLPAGCESNFSDKGIVAEKLGCGLPTDEFGELARDDIRARIDNIFINLQSDPTASALIISYGPPALVTKRHEIIRNHMESRKYSSDRIRLEYRAYEEKIRTRVWIVPAGGDPSLLN